MISFLRLLFKFVETNLSDACLWSKFLFPYSLRLSFSRPFQVISTKKNCIAFFALRINTCVCNIFHVLCSHAFELDVCYVMFGKLNIMWHEKYVGRKIERNGMPVRSLFVSIWFTYVSRRLLVLGQRQNINSTTKQYNNWLIFPKENGKKKSRRLKYFSNTVCFAMKL